MMGLFMLSLAGGAVWADWVQDGGSANINTSKSAMEPSVAFFNTIPYVAWREDNGTTYQVVMRHWTGSAWSTDRISLNADDNEWASNPRLLINSGVFYVIWSEGNTTPHIFARQYTGSSWSSAVNIQVNTTWKGVFPTLGIVNGTVYAAWKEQTGINSVQVYVKGWNGSSWVSRGGNLATDAYWYSSPSIAGLGNVPYVAYEEASGPTIVVKHWGGSGWVQDGGSLNVHPGNAAYKPVLVNCNGTLYAAWSEVYGTSQQIYVKHWTGSAWVQDGGSLNMSAAQDANQPAMVAVNGTPYVAWFESATKDQLYMKHWTGSDWVQDGNSFNHNTNLDNFGVSLAVSSSNVVYAAFVENPGTTPLHIQIYLKHYIAPTFTPTRTSTPTFTPTPTCTRTATGTSTVTLTPTTALTPASPSPTPTKTAQVVFTATAKPTSTITPLGGFNGKLLDKKYTYFAPNPMRGDHFKFVVHVPRACELKCKLYTTSRRFVLGFNLSCPGQGQYEHKEYVGNLANGVYLLLVKAKSADGTEDRVIKKLALIK